MTLPHSCHSLTRTSLLSSLVGSPAPPGNLTPLLDRSVRRPTRRRVCPPTCHWWEGLCNTCRKVRSGECGGGTLLPSGLGVCPSPSTARALERTLVSRRRTLKGFGSFERPRSSDTHTCAHRHEDGVTTPRTPHLRPPGRSCRRDCVRTAVG